MMRETKIINYNPSEGCRVEWREGPEDMSVDVMGLDVRRMEDSIWDFRQHEITISKWGFDHHSGPLVVEGDATLHALANVGDYRLNITINGTDVWAELVCLKTNERWPVRLLQSNEVSDWTENQILIDKEVRDEPTGCPIE